MKLGNGLHIKALYPPPLVRVQDLVDYQGNLTDLEENDVLHLKRFIGDGLSVDHLTLEIHRGQQRVLFWTEFTNSDGKKYRIKQDSIIIFHKSNHHDIGEIITEDCLFDRFFNAKVVLNKLPPGVHDDTSQMIAYKAIKIIKKR